MATLIQLYKIRLEYRETANCVNYEIIARGKNRNESEIGA